MQKQNYCYAIYVEIYLIRMSVTWRCVGGKSYYTAIWI